MTRYLVLVANGIGDSTFLADQMRYPNHMDHHDVLRQKIEQLRSELRSEIADIQLLNERYRLRGGNGAEAQLAHVKRHQRLEEIQQELVKLANLGRKVRSIEEIREKYRSRPHLVKRAS